MDLGNELRHVTVQSIREKFEVSARTQTVKHQADHDIRIEAAHNLETGSQSSENGGSPTESQMLGRAGIKRSPAFRTGKVEGLAINKKPSLKRKPGVDRTSKPNNIQLNINSEICLIGSSCESPVRKIVGRLNSVDGPEKSDDCLVEEALKAPLPNGPPPKKPPRTFMHDIYLGMKFVTPVESSANNQASPQRPARRKTVRNLQSNIPLGITRSKTEPTLTRRPKAEKGKESHCDPHTNLPFANKPRSNSDQSTRSSDITQSRWTNPVQWNSIINVVRSDAELDKKRHQHNGNDQVASVTKEVRANTNGTASTRHHPPTTDNGLHYMSSPVRKVADRNSNNDRPVVESDSECDNEIKLVENRKIYVRRVASNVCDMIKSRPFVSPSSKSTGNGLFDSIIVVALFYDRKLQQYTPYIKSHYPSHVSVPNGVEHFCFPDSANWPPPTQSATEPYTIVLTDSCGERQFGYCRRIVPEGSLTCIPITYCILTRNRSAGFYNKVSNVLIAYHGIAESQRLALLDCLYQQSFPAPGQFVEFFCDGKITKVQRLVDSRLEDTDLRVLFDYLDESVVLHVLGTCLLERKLLFISRHVGVLSICIDAVQSMLYPFVWQHTLVPVLPESMTEICSAPTPYVMGVLSRNISDVQAIFPDEGMLVDLDSGKVLHCVGDEASILPRATVKHLKMTWDVTVTITQQQESIRNALFSESFVRMFVDLCGHYGQHIHSSQTGSKHFEKMDFVRNHTSQSVRMFLEWFSETAMFNLFIESRLRGDASPTLFDHKIIERAYSGRNNQAVLRNSKMLGRKIKTIGDKLREMNVFS